MAVDRMFRELCKPRLMQIGWHLAQADSRDDFVRDPVGNADFADGLTERLRYLLEQVEALRYRPRHLLEVDIPKSGLSVRPGNVLPIEEASLLHAVVYLMAPRLDRFLRAGVYSYRLHKDWEKKARKGESLFREGDVRFPFLRRKTIGEFSPFEEWYAQWPAAEKAARAAATVEGYTHLTKADIASYFENIDLRLLMEQIRGLLKQREEKTLQLLFRVLEGWRRTTSAGLPLDRGIPQGNEVSSFLGNLYLIPLDDALVDFCRSRDAKWFRYVDDVKVFTRRAEDAREAVFVVNDALRALHLNLQGSKTRILTGDALRDELSTTDMDRVNRAITEIAVARSRGQIDKRGVTRSLKSISSICARFTRGLPASVRNLDGAANRLFRRVLTAYGSAGRSRSKLPSAAMTAIKELPDLRVLRSCLRYLSQLPYVEHGRSVEALLKMLENNELLFPYQVGSVLEALRKFHPRGLSKDTGSRIRRYAFGAGLKRVRDWLVVAKGLEALGSFPYKDKYFDAITKAYVAHEHPVVRRAAVSVVPRCPKHIVRERTLQLIRHPDSGVSRMAIWLHRLHADTTYAREELARVRKGSLDDDAIVTRLPTLYAMSSTESRNLASELALVVRAFPRGASDKVDWHRAELLRRLEWSVRVVAAGQVGGAK